MNVKIKLNDGNAFIPKKGTEGAAAFDVFIPTDTLVRPGRQVIPLGFSLEFPIGYEAKIEPRSGYSVKGMEDQYGERKDADVLMGKIDSDYRGIVGVIVKSQEHYPFILKRGTRIGQMTFYKVESVSFSECDTLTETDRGEAGFGSTGN